MWDEGFHKFTPDQTPIEMPLHYKRPEPLHDLIRRLVRNEANQAYIAAQGAETFEEADDFDVDEEATPISNFEMTEMQEEYVSKPIQPDPSHSQGNGTEETQPEPITEADTVAKRHTKAKKTVAKSDIDKAEVTA